MSTPTEHKYGIAKRVYAVALDIEPGQVDETDGAYSDICELLNADFCELIEPLALAAGLPDDAEPWQILEWIEERARPVDRSELSVDQSTPYRLSPAGVLVERRIMPGYPSWVVLRAPRAAGLYIGQRITDQHVAAWSPLIRKNTSGKD